MLNSVEYEGKIRNNHNCRKYSYTVHKKIIVFFSKDVICHKKVEAYSGILVINVATRDWIQYLDALEIFINNNTISKYYSQIVLHTDNAKPLKHPIPFQNKGKVVFKTGIPSIYYRVQPS